jgi:hypothetical protein
MWNTIMSPLELATMSFTEEYFYPSLIFASSEGYAMLPINAHLYKYFKQSTQMRQLGCMSADVYCQITNNFYFTTSSFYTQMERRGKGLAAGETKRERESVRETESR